MKTRNKGVCLFMISLLCKLLRKTVLGGAAIGWAMGGAMSDAKAAEITLFAAASLQEVLQEVAHGFEQQTGHDMVLSFAGSSALARQIEYGAPADVFMSANVDWLTYLERRELLATNSKQTIYGNDLAVVVPVNSAAIPVDDVSLNLLKIVNNGRVAMALVEAVPAGIYGREALETLGQWTSMQSQVVQLDNVRAALALVALGEAQAGVVYVTDANAEPRVRIITKFSKETHAPIVYPAAIVAGRDRPEVRAFMTYLAGDAARAVFVAQGFTLVEETP